MSVLYKMSTHHIIRQLCLLTILSAGTCRAEDYHVPFTFVEYNCENLFDCVHDSLKNDHEFMPDAERHWTFSRYWKKLNNIGRVIQQCGENMREPADKLRTSNAYAYHLPDLVALCEVENDSTMLMLTHASMLKGAGYRYVMTNSPDHRGIDVALLYNPLTFRLTEHHSIRISPPEKGMMPTRDLLYAKGAARSGDTLHIIAVHAPSRSGGQVASEPYRLTVAQRIIQTVDSIRSEAPQACIIIAGDFNDYSRDKSLRLIGNDSLYEVSESAVGFNHSITDVTGTYKYGGEWNSLDHIFLSRQLNDRVKNCYILDNEWMLEKDSQGGYKPFRTFRGPLYNKGVSDHLPLVLHLEL